MSPAPLKANGSSHSSGKFKLGGVRPAKMGALEATGKGMRAGAQRTGFACQAPCPGPGPAAALHPCTGAQLTKRPAKPLKAALNRSLVPRAAPCPVWACPGSAAVEQGSGCLQSSPLTGLCCSEPTDHSPPCLPLSSSVPNPGHRCPSVSEYRNRRNGGPSLHASGGPYCPQLA